MTALDDPRELDELLGAYALDACDPDEAAAIDRYVAANPAAADEVTSLRGAAAWVGATEALAPPAALRESVLATIHAGRAAGDDPVLATYVEEMARYDALVDELSPETLELPTANGLIVRDLVIHLAAQESMLAAAVGEPVGEVADIVGATIEGRTAEFVARYRDRPLGDAREVWRAAGAAIRRWAAHADRELAVRWFGYEMRGDEFLIIRAFETWIHGDDIRRALQHRLEPPAPVGLHAMADVFMTSMLSSALVLTGRDRPGQSARVTLRGPGGGTWLVPFGAGPASGAPAVTLTADVVDWCMLVGKRIDPRRLVHEVEGDRGLAADLVAAAPALATL
jgi:uncharacterized protein (TIGR03083 family)